MENIIRGYYKGVLYIISNESKYSTLYDHYKESVTYLKNDLIKRDKITVGLLLLFAIYFVIEISPIDSVLLANKYITSKLGLALNINYKTLATIILLLLLVLIVRYFQICLSIEKQYSYIHCVENKINTMSSEELITREGYSYLKEYPLLLAVIHRIYNFFLPVVIIIAMSVKGYELFKVSFDKSSIINIMIIFLIIICTILYLLFIYREVKFVNWINSKIKILFIKLFLYKED